MSAFSAFHKLFRKSPGTGADELSHSYLQHRLIVIDIETSGLDVRQSEIVSLGWVIIEQGEICLSSCQHVLVNSARPAGESVTIHGIRDIDRRRGATLRQSMELLTEAAKDCILVFHHAGLDLRFLKAASVQVGLPDLNQPCIDTLRLEQRRLQCAGSEIYPGTLTLAKCREKYGLPAAPRHNALEDALATAELALAMFHDMSRSRPLLLKELV